MITPLTPDSFLRHREEEEIAIGLKLLASPETSTNEGLKSTCTEENLLNRVLVREHLGIANVAAEEFFEQKLLPFMKKKHVLLDIGANTGQFSIPMASRGHRAVSFEPSQSTCKILRGNMERANVSSLIVLHCAAADSEVKSAIFHQDPNLTVASGNKQITSELAQKLRNAGRGDEITVTQTVTVDSVVDHDTVFLLKTDTQGYEMSVLKGASQLLKQGNIKFLLIEFSYFLLNKAKTSPVALLEYIYSHGYMCTYLGYHTVTSKVGHKKSYSIVSGPRFDNKLSVSFEKIVDSLRLVVAPDAPFEEPGWSDLFCWNRCIST